MQKAICPFAEGDRVDHKIFGLGTVVGAPVAVVGPSANNRGIEDKGWHIRVRWDNTEKTEGDVAHWALRKLSSPDARPFTYWDRHWQPLLQAWLKARREVEQLASSFRPTPDQEELARALRAETEAYAAIVAFQAEDARRVETESTE